MHVCDEVVETVEGRSCHAYFSCNFWVSQDEILDEMELVPYVPWIFIYLVFQVALLRYHPTWKSLDLENAGSWRTTLPTVTGTLKGI